MNKPVFRCTKYEYMASKTYTLNIFQQVQCSPSKLDAVSLKALIYIYS